MVDLRLLVIVVGFFVVDDVDVLVFVTICKNLFFALARVLMKDLISCWTHSRSVNLFLLISGFFEHSCTNLLQYSLGKQIASFLGPSSPKTCAIHSQPSLSNDTHA